MSAQRHAKPRSLLIALLAALLIHAFLIFGVRYELPRSGQPSRKAISMTLVRPNPPKLAEVTPETPPPETVQPPLPSEVAPPPRQAPAPETKAESKPPEKPLAPAKPKAGKVRTEPATPTNMASPPMVGPPRPESQFTFVGPPKPAASNAFVGPPSPMPKVLDQTQKQLAANQLKTRPSATPNPTGRTAAKTEAPIMPMESSPEPPAQASTPSRPAETEAKPSLPWDDEDESPEDDDQLADASESDEDEPAEEDEQRVLQGDNNQSKADRRTTTTTPIQPPTQPSAAIPASRGGLIKPEVGSPTQAAPPTRTPQSPAGAINPTPVVEAERASVSSHSRTLGSPDSPFPQPRQLPVAPPPKPPAPPSAATRDRTPSKPIEPIQTEAPKSTPPSDGAVSRPSPKPEPTPARSKTLANAELTTKASPSRKSDDQDERKTQKKTAPPSAAKNGGKGDKPVKPAFSASLLSQQIAEVSADIYRQRSDEMRDKKIVYATEVKTNRLVVAAYEQAWQEKVERIGNLNYPDEARRDKLSGTLMVAVGIKPDGSVYSVQVQQPSGHEALDNAARNIVRLAAPFAPLPQEIRNEVDILVITRTWRFDSNYHLETRVR